MDEDEHTLTMRQPSLSVELLRSKFDEDIVNQAQRLDDIVKLLNK